MWVQERRIWLHKCNGRKLQVYRKPKVTTCTDRAGLWGKIVGIASGLSFCFLGHDPSSSFWSLTMYSKQWASKCSEHRRGLFGKDVLLTAWIQARRNLLSFEKTWKLILVSFLFFAWLLQPKATHRFILTVRSNHDMSSARSALRTIQDGSRGNF